MIILAHCSNGYRGCEDEDIFLFSNDSTDNEIDEQVWNWACENANNYSYVHFGWDAEITDDEWDEYLEEWVSYDYDEITYEEYVKWCNNWGYTPESREIMEE